MQTSNLLAFKALNNSFFLLGLSSLPYIRYKKLSASIETYFKCILRLIHIHFPVDCSPRPPSLNSIWLQPWISLLFLFTLGIQQFVHGLTLSIYFLTHSSTFISSSFEILQHFFVFFQLCTLSYSEITWYLCLILNSVYIIYMYLILSIQLVSWVFENRLVLMYHWFFLR